MGSLSQHLIIGRSATPQEGEPAENLQLKGSLWEKHTKHHQTTHVTLVVS